MRVTVCELPHRPDLVEAAWTALCDHASRSRSEWVLLPEFALVEPVWETETFDAARWSSIVEETDAWMARLGELGGARVVGARPITAAGHRYNEGFVWSSEDGYVPLRRKFFLPDEPGGREAVWFERGDREFPVFNAGTVSFGLNICTELWAIESYGSYAQRGAQLIFSPRATAALTTAKWLAVGTVAAVRTGGFSVSSNRVHTDGSCGGVGWIIDPDGRVLGTTSASDPCLTLDIDPDASRRARQTYPRYVFAG